MENCGGLGAGCGQEFKSYRMASEGISHVTLKSLDSTKGIPGKGINKISFLQSTTLFSNC